MEQKALKFLEANRLLHMGMIFPIKRGTADIIYCDIDGVFLKEQISGVYMLSANNFDKSKEFLDTVEGQACFCVHQKMFADYLDTKYEYQNHLTCYQAVYERSEHILRQTSLLDIKRLDKEYIDIVYSHYHSNVDYDYLKRRLECGEIYGGFLNGELCGFVGTHEEGSIGILEIFDQYRKRGFGAELESYIVNLILDRRQVPFAQISVGNDASLKLHEKLGFKISTDMLYWLF